jgi:hypothetical protein
MAMKRAYSFLLVALVVGFFSACSNLDAPSMGHLSISVPYSVGAAKSLASDSRVLTFTGSGTPSIRVYVLLNGSFIKSSSGNYYLLDESLGTTENPSYSIDLQAASNYKVYIALGTKSSGLWTPVYYGSSDTFAVSPGVYTNTTVTVDPANFAATYASSSAPSTVSVDGALWRAGSFDGRLVLTDGTDANTVSLADLGTINSLSSGKWFKEGEGFASEPWVNMSTGIYAFRGGALKLVSSVKADYSGAITADIDTLKGCLLVYYYGSDLGFSYTNTRTAGAVDASWKSESLSAFLASSDGESFRDLISDASSFAKAAAFVVDGPATYGFISTALGTYLYNQTIQTEMGKDPMGWLKNQITSSAYATAAYSGGKSVQISSLALDDGASPKYLYAGTASGLFQAKVTGLATATKAPTLDTLVSGVKVQQLAAVTFNGVSYAAYVDGEGLVTVLKDAVASATYPFYSYTAAPSGIRGLSFYLTADDALDLAITSADGLAIAEVAK